LDPTLLLRLMHDEDPDVGRVTLGAYDTLYHELRDAYLKQHGANTVSVAALLEQIDNALVEDAFRSAGFVVGFEVCRHLILGELDLEALQADEAEAEDGGVS
jgi:hypothetical protein